MSLTQQQALEALTYLNELKAQAYEARKRMEEFQTGEAYLMAYETWQEAEVGIAETQQATLEPNAPEKGCSDWPVCATARFQKKYELCEGCPYR